MRAPRFAAAASVAGLFTKKGKGSYATKRGARARAQAEAAYEQGRNLRPVEDAPREFLEKLRGALAEAKVVEAATLAEYKSDEGGERSYLVGIRMRRGASVPYQEVKRRVLEALGGKGPFSKALEVTDLDKEVDATTADGSPNPYLVFEG